MSRLLALALAAGLALAVGVGETFAQPADPPPPPAEDPPPPADEQPPAEAPPPAEEQPAQAPPAEPPPAAAPAEEPPAADTATPEEAPAATAESDVATDTDEVPLEDEVGEVIVMTGSTIARKQLTTAAPVAVIDKAELDAAGLVSVGDILQNLPAQSNAINVQVNNGGDGSTRINLRGLGTFRTLVLVNGRRHVPGGNGANSSVDLNAIPVAMIERVEVLKDGASAVYGSDAIAGVVNIITRDDFEGSEANLYTGSTQRGDGIIYDVSVVSGVKSKRGSFVFSAGYYQQGDVFAGDRDFSRTDKSYDWAANDGSFNERGSSATPGGTIIDNGRGASAKWDELAAGCRATFDPMGELDAPGLCYNDGNGWRPLDAGGNSDTGTGDLYNYQPENYLLTPQKRYNFFSQGKWELRDDVRAFFETSYTRRKSDQQLAPEPLFTSTEGLVVSGDNVYNPFGRDFYDVRRRLVEFGNRRFLQDVDTYRLVTGLEGKLPKNWRWNAYYNFGRTEGTEVNQGRLVLDRLQNALGPSFMGPEGPTCGTPDNPIPDCTPLNLFDGVGSITPDMVAGLTYTGIARGFTMQNSVHGTTYGKLVDTPWGGDVRLAVGAGFRRERGESIPDPITAAGNTSGNKEEPTSGSFDVVEGHAELSIVPVIKRGMIDWLEISLAARGFRYDTFGTGVTYKAGGLWRSPFGLAVRGTYSTAFRAPSVGELFSGNADAFPSVSDPCSSSNEGRTAVADANCSMDDIPDGFTDIRDQLRSRIGGNPDLDNETADIVTGGLVYEPEMVKGLAFTFDYFWINIDNAIQNKSAAVILSNCYNQVERTDCDRINRDPVTNQIVFIDDRVTNIGGNKTAGLDFQVRYDWGRPDLGRLRHNLEGTYLIKYNETQADGRIIEGKGIYDLGVHPSLRFNLSTIWSMDNLSAGFNARYIGGFEECQDNDCDTALDEDLAGFDPSVARDVDINLTADLWLGYQIDGPVGTARVTAGVNNILDQDPAVVFNGFLASSDAETYDYLGRYYYLRLTQSF